jgi:hypothetical protein
LITSTAVVTNGIVNGSTSNTGTISAGVDAQAGPRPTATR